MGPFEKLTARLDLEKMVGLEIGALFRPQVDPKLGTVRYLDHLSTDGLREKYGHDPNVAPHLDEIVNVDYVMDPGMTLVDAVRGDRFDYVIASHVIEHVPDLIRWLRDIATILRPSGFLCLAIPDMHYSFDARRQATTPAQVVDAYLRQVTIPTFQQTFDFHYEVTPDIDPVKLWDDRPDLTSLRRHGDGAAMVAMDRCEHIGRTGDYEDVHCSVFSPESLMDVFEAMMRLRLWDFHVVDFHPTEHGQLEFFLTLQQLPLDENAEPLQLKSIESVRRASPLRAEVAGESVVLSPSEMKLVKLKRDVLFKARTLARSVARR